MYCFLRAIGKKAHEHLQCKSFADTAALQFCIHKAAEMFELKHGGPRRFRRTSLWPTALHFSVQLPIHARFQAPGEQVEIMKSASQPHLNGLQGYVDFSCLTWYVFFLFDPSLISCHLFMFSFAGSGLPKFGESAQTEKFDVNTDNWWHPSLLR